MKNVSAGFITRAAVIGALYAALTIALAPISFGLIQFRVAEALTVLAFFTPAAIPGLFVGCLAANIFGSSMGILDIVFGSLSTLVAAYLTHKIKNRYLAPLPPVIINALVVGLIVAHYFEVPVHLAILYVGAGQLAVCYLLGLPLLIAMEPLKERLFENKK